MNLLPIFPLNTILFPGAALKLHIFEPRYINMLQTLSQDDPRFGVVLIKNGMEASGPLPNPYFTGCTAVIKQTERLPDGRLNLITQGEQLFQITRIYHDLPYLRALVNPIQFFDAHTDQVVQNSILLKRAISLYLAKLLSSGLTQIKYTRFPIPSTPMEIYFLAADLLQIPLYEKQKMLEARSAAELGEFIKRVYLREIALLSQPKGQSHEEARQRAWLN